MGQLESGCPGWWIRVHVCFFLIGAQLEVGPKGKLADCSQVLAIFAQLLKWLLPCSLDWLLGAAARPPAGLTCTAGWLLSFHKHPEMRLPADAPAYMARPKVTSSLIVFLQPSPSPSKTPSPSARSWWTSAKGELIEV